MKDPTLQQRPIKFGCLPQKMDESSPGFHDMNALEMCSDCRKKIEEIELASQEQFKNMVKVEGLAVFFDFVHPSNWIP